MKVLLGTIVGDRKNANRYFCTLFSPLASLFFGEVFRTCTASIPRTFLPPSWPALGSFRLCFSVTALPQAQVPSQASRAAHPAT